MHNRQKLLLRITCFFWFITKIASYKTWIAEGRLYPVVPPFEFLEAVPNVFHTLLFGLSLLLLTLLFIFPQKRLILISTLLVILCSCSLDVLRWQPWEYQFIFFLIIFIINRDNPKALYSAIIFVLASVYIYSGLHKLNGGFLHSVWESMILHRFFGISGAAIRHLKLHYIGLALPVIETAAGLGLLFLRRKFVPAVILIGMHVFIIILLSGAGINYNSIVLPWNFAMVLFLYFFYMKEPYNFAFPDVINRTNAIVFLMWGIMPAFSFIGYWDKMLSSSLYSGNAKRLDICIENTDGAKQLSPYFSNSDKRNNCTGARKLSLSHWSNTEMGVMPYPEEWYFKKLKAKYEKMYPGTQASFIMYAYPYSNKVELE
jgi:hypothetical protein